MSDIVVEHLFADTTLQKIDTRTKTEDDIAYDACISVTIDKYPSEFKDATDEDIGSILEEISKLAGVLCSSSESDFFKTEQPSRNSAEKEKSVEELLEKAEELIRKNTRCISEKILNSHELVPDCNVIVNAGTEKLRKFDPKIFERIEEQVRSESEKNVNCPAGEKRKTSQHQKEKFSTRCKNEEKMSLFKNNLQKELIEVDENFFDGILSKYMGDIEKVISTNSSFTQKEFSQSLEPLETSFENNRNDALNSNYTLNYISKHSDAPVMSFSGNLQKRNFQTPNFYAAKNTTEILDKVLSHTENLETESDRIESSSVIHVCELEQFQNDTNSHSFCDQKQVKSSSRNTSSVSDLNVNFNALAIGGQSNSIKDLNSKNDKYALNLTPRLQLFADSVSKFMIEKSKKNSKVPKKDVIYKNKKLLISSSIEAGEINPLNQKKSESSENCNKIYETLTNLGFLFLPEKAIKSSVECLKTDYHRKQSFAKKVLCKSNLNLIRKVKLAVKSRKYIFKSGAITKAVLSTQSYDTKDNLLVNYWKARYHREEEKAFLMKIQLNMSRKFYKAQIRKMFSSFDQELSSLSKKNIILKTEIDQLFMQKKRPQFEEHKKATNFYEAQRSMFVKDKACCSDAEVNNSEQKIMPVEVDDVQAKISKLYCELSKLRQQNLDLLLRNEDTNQQNALLTDEIKMFKDQLEEKNTFIAERLQAMEDTETKLRKQIENLKVDLNTKVESLKLTKLSYDQLEETLFSLENELLQFRVKESNLHENLAIIKNQAQREKQLSQKLKNQVILDSTKIMDLTRQVLEMERIIKRKNPDSVSALILTAKSDQDGLLLEKIKLLEERNTTLENEIEFKDKAAQQKLADFQKRFEEIKKNNIMEIAELEDKLLCASMKIKNKNIDMSTQTVFVSDKSKKLETWKEKEKTPSFENDDEKDSAYLSKVDRLKFQTKNNDVHLITSICRLKLELSNKNKVLSKLSNEFQELHKTNRRLQKEREKQLNDRRAVFKNLNFNIKNHRSLLTSENASLDLKSFDVNHHSSHASSTEYVLSLQECSESKQKIYDPLQYSEYSESNMANKLVIENSILKEELRKMKKDFMSLESKRMGDLNLLQQEHERELTVLIKKFSAKVDDMNVLKLEGKKVMSMC